MVNFGSIESESDRVDPRQLRILEKGKPVECPDHDLWVRWMGEHSPTICLSKVGVFVIETGFTGIWEDGCLWETKVTPRFTEGSPERYSHKSAEIAIRLHSDLIRVAVDQMRIREREQEREIVELEEEKGK